MTRLFFPVVFAALLAWNSKAIGDEETIKEHLNNAKNVFDQEQAQLHDMITYAVKTQHNDARQAGDPSPIHI